MVTWCLLAPRKSAHNHAPESKDSRFQIKSFQGIRETTTEIWGPDIRICVPAEYVCGLRDHNESHLSLGIVYNICSSFWGLWPMSVENGSWITQWTLNPISFQWSSSVSSVSHSHRLQEMEVPLRCTLPICSSAIVQMSSHQAGESWLKIQLVPTLLGSDSVRLKAELEPRNLALNLIWKDKPSFDLRASSCTSYTSNSLGFLKSRVSQVIHYPWFRDC